MVTDREKVIKGIESCEPSVFKRICTNCPYREEMNCDYVLWHDAIELLKEQEAVKPIEMQLMDDFSCFASYFLCSICGYELIGKDVMFCSHCGRAVKWE